MQVNCRRAVMECTWLLVAVMMWTTVVSTANVTSYVTSWWQRPGNETELSSPAWNNNNNNTQSSTDNNGSTAQLTTTEPSWTSYWQWHATLSWFRNAPPVLVVLATVGNTFSVITLQNPM